MSSKATRRLALHSILTSYVVPILILLFAQMAVAQQLILSSKISKEDFQMIRRVHVQGLWSLTLFVEYAQYLMTFLGHPNMGLDE